LIDSKRTVAWARAAASNPFIEPYGVGVGILLYIKMYMYPAAGAAG